MMTTLVVGPFYLPGALELDAASVGLVMSIGPLVAALTGVPAAASPTASRTAHDLVGLAGIATGALALVTSRSPGVAGYVAPMSSSPPATRSS